ncbi:hypothetical protein JKF63_05964 [Porcisia hertigi]|uniref:Uncharacterized protein n=1 Tax=Porcisia hertigi TaxID=2761500 RepID=A0A836I875_9TRYP|nr:hypothetical protein JKF63_05964 [Porcisia hertigi]
MATMPERPPGLSMDGAAVSTLSPLCRNSVAHNHGAHQQPSVHPTLATSTGGGNNCNGDSAAAGMPLKSPFSTLLSACSLGPNTPPLLSSQTSCSAMSIGEAHPAPAGYSESPPQDVPADVVARLNPLLLCMAQVLCNCPLAEAMCPALVVGNSKEHILAAETTSATPASSSRSDQMDALATRTTTGTENPVSQKKTLSFSVRSAPNYVASSNLPHHADPLHSLVDNATAVDCQNDEPTEGTRGIQQHHHSVAAGVEGDTSNATVEGAGGPKASWTDTSNMPVSVSKTSRRGISTSWRNEANATATVGKNPAAATTAENPCPPLNSSPADQCTNDDLKPSPPGTWPIVYANDAAVSMMGCHTLEEVMAPAFDDMFCCFVRAPPVRSSGGSIANNNPLASLLAITTSSTSQLTCCGVSEVTSNGEGDDREPQTQQQSSNTAAQPEWRKLQTLDELLAVPQSYVILYCKHTSAYYAAFVASRQSIKSQRTILNDEKARWALPAKATSKMPPATAAATSATNAGTSLEKSHLATLNQPPRSASHQCQPHSPVPKKVSPAIADAPLSRLTDSEEAIAVDKSERRTSMTTVATNSPSDLGSDLSGAASPLMMQQQQQQQKGQTRYLEIYILQRLQSSIPAAGAARPAATRTVALELPPTLTLSAGSAFEARQPRPRTKSSPDWRFAAHLTPPFEEAPRFRSPQSSQPTGQRLPRLPISPSATTTAIGTAMSGAYPLDAEAPRMPCVPYVDRSHPISLLPSEQNRRRCQNSRAETSEDLASNSSQRPRCVSHFPNRSASRTSGCRKMPSANSEGTTSALRNTSLHTNQNNLLELSYPPLQVNLAQPTSATSDCLYGASAPASAPPAVAAVCELPLPSSYKPGEKPRNNRTTRSMKTALHAHQPKTNSRNQGSCQAQQQFPTGLAEDEDGATAAADGVSDDVVMQLKGGAVTKPWTGIPPLLQPASEAAFPKCRPRSAQPSATNIAITLLSGTRSRMFSPLDQPVGHTCQDKNKGCSQHHPVAFAGGPPPSARGRGDSQKLTHSSVSPLNSYPSITHHSTHSGRRLSLVGSDTPSVFGERRLSQSVFPGATIAALQQQQHQLSDWVISTETSVAQPLGNMSSTSRQRGNEVDQIEIRKLADRVRSQRGIVAVLTSRRLPQTIIFNSIAFMMILQHVLRFQHGNGVAQVACILNVRSKTQLVIDMIPVEVLMRTSGRTTRTETVKESRSTYSVSPVSHSLSTSWRTNNLNAESGNGSGTITETVAKGNKPASTLYAQSYGQHATPVLMSSPSLSAHATPSQQKALRLAIVELLGAKLEELDVLYSKEESRQALPHSAWELDGNADGLPSSPSGTGSGSFADPDNNEVLPTATGPTKAASSVGGGADDNETTSAPHGLRRHDLARVPAPIRAKGDGEEIQTEMPLCASQSSFIPCVSPRQPHDDDMRHLHSKAYYSHLNQQLAHKRHSYPTHPTANAQQRALASCAVSRGGDHENKSRRSASCDLGTCSGSVKQLKGRGCAWGQGAAALSARRSSCKAFPVAQATMVTDAATRAVSSSASGSMRREGSNPRGRVEARLAADSRQVRSLYPSRSSSVVVTTISDTTGVAPGDAKKRRSTTKTSSTIHTPDPRIADAWMLETGQQQQIDEGGDEELWRRRVHINKSENIGVIEAAAKRRPKSLRSYYSGSENQCQEPRHRHRSNVPRSHYLSPEMEETLSMCDGAARIRADTYEARVRIPFTTPDRLELLSQLGNVQLSKHRGISVLGVNLVNLATDEAAAKAAEPLPQIIPLRYDLVANSYLRHAHSKQVTSEPLMSPTTTSKSSSDKAAACASADKAESKEKSTTVIAEPGNTKVETEAAAATAAAANAPITHTFSKPPPPAAGAASSAISQLHPPSLVTPSTTTFAATTFSESINGSGPTDIGSRNDTPDGARYPTRANSSSMAAVPCSAAPATRADPDKMMTPLGASLRKERLTVSAGTAEMETAQLQVGNTLDFSTAHASEDDLLASDLSVASKEELPNVEDVADRRRVSWPTTSGEASASQRHAGASELLMDPSQTSGTRRSGYRGLSMLSMAAADNDDNNDDDDGEPQLSDKTAAALEAEAVKSKVDCMRRPSFSVENRAGKPSEGDSLRAVAAAAAAAAAASTSSLNLSGASLQRKATGLQLPTVLLNDTTVTSEGKHRGAAGAKKGEKERPTLHRRTSSPLASVQNARQPPLSTEAVTPEAEVSKAVNTAATVSTGVAHFLPQQQQQQQQKPQPQSNLAPGSDHYVVERSAQSAQTATPRTPATTSQELRQTPFHVELSSGESWAVTSQSALMSPSSNVLSASCTIGESGASTTAKGWTERAAHNSLSGTRSAQQGLFSPYPGCLPHPIKSDTTPLGGGSVNQTELHKTHNSAEQGFVSVCTQRSGKTEIVGYMLSTSAVAALSSLSTALEKEGDERHDGSMKAGNREDSEGAKRSGASPATVSVAALPVPIVAEAGDAKASPQKPSELSALSRQAPKSVVATGISMHTTLLSISSNPAISTAAAKGDMVTPLMGEKSRKVSNDPVEQKHGCRSGSPTTPAAARSAAGAGEDLNGSSSGFCSPSRRDESNDSFADGFADIFGLVTRPQQLTTLRRCAKMHGRGACDHGPVSSGSAPSTLTEALQEFTPSFSTVNDGAVVAVRPIPLSTASVSSPSQSRADKGLSNSENGNVVRIAGLSSTTPSSLQNEDTLYQSIASRFAAEETTEQEERGNLHVLVYTTRVYPEVEELLGIYGHCATFVTNTTRMLRYARSGLQFFDAVIVEWVDSLISAEVYEMFAKHAIEETVVVFFISTKPGVSTPTVKGEDIMTDATVVMRANDLLDGLLSRSVLEEVQQLIRRRRLLRSMLSMRKEHAYQIVGNIGSGAFGDVFEVMMYVSRGRLAMKRIFLNNMKLRQLEIINREVSIMRSLDHPNIVSFSHTRLEDKAYAIFMELCDGTLADHLEPSLTSRRAMEEQQHHHHSGAGTLAGGADDAMSITSASRRSNSASGNGSDSEEDFTGAPRTATHTSGEAVKPSPSICRPAATKLTRPQDAVMIVHDIASALSYLHSRGIVHRDIKPANVLFANGMAKLGDFGCAVRVSESRKLHNMKGTVGYMAPEMVLGETYTESCDLWSFGCLIAKIMGITLGHLNGLHMPALIELYQSIPQTGSLPLTLTNETRSRFGNHYTEAATHRVLKALKFAMQMDTTARQKVTSPHLTSSVNGSSTAEGNVGQNDSRQAFFFDDGALHNTCTPVTFTDQELLCNTELEDTVDPRHPVLCMTTSDMDVLGEFTVQLPASLVDLFNRLLHRDPTKRMTAAEVLDHQVSWDVEWMACMMKEIHEASSLLAQSAAYTQGMTPEVSEPLRGGVRPGRGRVPQGEEGAATPHPVKAGNLALLPIHTDSAEAAQVDNASGGRGTNIPPNRNSYMFNLSLSSDSDAEAADN